MLRHTTKLPCVMGAGLGVNDCAPLWPVIVTVMAPFGGVLEGGVGMPGPLDPAPPLQPPAARTSIAQDSTPNRMTPPDYASRMPGRARAVLTERVPAWKPRD